MIFAASAIVFDKAVKMHIKAFKFKLFVFPFINLLVKTELAKSQ